MASRKEEYKKKFVNIFSSPDDNLSRIEFICCWQRFHHFKILFSLLLFLEGTVDGNDFIIRNADSIFFSFFHYYSIKYHKIR